MAKNTRSPGGFSAARKRRHPPAFWRSIRSCSWSTAEPVDLSQSPQLTDGMSSECLARL